MCAVALALSACKSKDQANSFVVDDERAMHEAMVNNMWAEHADAAVSSATVLYPYHFENASNELNELGHAEVAVLTNSYDGRKLTVHLARGGASDELYQDRVNAVRQAFIDAGANGNMIAFDDKLSGGNGMSTDRVLFNASREAEQLRPVYGSAETSTGTME
jgi:hypothetical protein